MKRALILGIGGQDGSYLADLLLEKGYEVHGLHRRSSVDNLTRIAHIRDRVTLHRGDLSDVSSLYRVLEKVDADEIYNMADQDEVGWSVDGPLYSVSVTYGGPVAILEWVKMARHDWIGRSGPRFFQPVSSTMFGLTDSPQDENTPLNPGSPYACAKAAAFLLCRHYRREHGLFVSCGIMFNHDSPRRGPNYLLQQIARQAVAVSRGERDRIELTGPDAVVDVGWAPEFMEVAHNLLQQDAPDDYVVGTGYGFRVSDLCSIALDRLGLSRERFKLTNGSTPLFANKADTTKVREGLEWVAEQIAGNVVCELVDHFKGVK